ncbi:MAG TPA: hypothetical protein DEB06_10505 [Phycisphaerales bacterium]|nr:hypothetical protein [Phycisphaerales bacterium]
MDPPLARRFRIESPEQFTPRAGRVLVGDAFPAIDLQPNTIPGPAPDLTPPGAVLFFRTWTMEVATGVEALRGENAERPGFGVTLALVFDSIVGDRAQRLAGTTACLGHERYHLTDDPAHSVSRFADGDSVLVVFDRTNTVRLIEDLGSLLSRGPEHQTTLEFRAAPDPGAAGALRARIRGALAE